MKKQKIFTFILLTWIFFCVSVPSQLQSIATNDILHFRRSAFQTSVSIVSNDQDIVKAGKKKIRKKNKREQQIPKSFPVLTCDLSKAPYTEEEQLLARLLEAEAGTEGLHGKRLVADVVMNRVRSDIFPDSIYDVIHQRLQFSVISDGRFNRVKVTEESLKAARIELRGIQIDSGILYFNSGPSCANGRSPWKYKNHWFAY